MVNDLILKFERPLNHFVTMGSVLNICRRKSSSAESRSAESLLKGQTSLFNIEHNPVPCFFRALKQRFNIIKISVMY